MERESRVERKDLAKVSSDIFAVGERGAVGYGAVERWW